MIVNTSAAVSSAGLAVYSGEEASQESSSMDSIEWIDEADEASDVLSDVPSDPQSDVVIEVKLTKSFDELLFWKEIELIAKLSDMKQGLDEVAEQLVQAKAEWKSLKDEASQALEAVGECEDRLKELTEQFMKAAFALCELASGVVTELPKKAQSDDAEVAEDNGWRLHPTSELLSGMKGSNNKRDVVAEAIPTVGQLEDLRAEASKDCVGFHEKLPKGCGKGLAQSIEDLLVEFIGKWVANKTNPVATAKVDELLSEVREAAKQNDWEPLDCASKETDSVAMRAGFAAFGESRPHTDVLMDDPHAAKQWMTGWVSGEVLWNFATGSEAK